VKVYKIYYLINKL